VRPIDFFDTAADAHGDSVAVIDGDVRFSFDGLRTASNTLAAVLQESSGDTPATIAIVAPNGPHVIVCTLAAMRAGAAIAPVHVKESEQRKSDFLVQARPRWVFYHSVEAAAMHSVKPRLAETTTWVCIDDRVDGDLALTDMIGAEGRPLRDWGDEYGSPSRPVYIRQTSGSTGAPKTIVNDIGSYAATMSVLRQVLKSDDAKPTCLVLAPLSHAAGVHAFAMLTLGATLIVPSDFNPRRVLRTIETHRVTHMWMPPTALFMLLNAAREERVDCSSLRSVALGSAATPVARLREAVTLFGPCVSVSYAQIEAGFLTWLDAATLVAALAGCHPERAQSVGTSLCVSRVAIETDDGQLAPSGAVGEIVVRGRSVKPYLDGAEQDGARERGWHHTGDAGYFDRDGYLYIVGRKKDTINTCGFKVSASEVEDAILELPQIGDCAVVGVPDAMRGEVVTAAIVVRQDAEITNRALLRHCRKRLGDAKSPRHVVRCAELPKSAVGKVDKHALKARLIELTESADPQKWNPNFTPNSSVVFKGS
jgi:fatty-acyl-CoA synthase